MKWSLVLVATVVAGLASGCGGGGSASPGPVVTVTEVPTPTVSTTASSAAPTPGPSGPTTLAAAFNDDSSGVVRIDTSDCDGEPTGTGSGFLLGPNLVATVAHVVKGAAWIRVTSPQTTQAVAGVVVGYSHARDLALVRTSSALSGHVFTLSTGAPAIGQRIGAVGFSLGKSMQLSPGDVTDTHDHRFVGGDADDSYDLADQAITDAAINPGNSGGPWLNSHGTVVALTESGPPYDEQSGSPAEGNNGGIPAVDAAAEFSKWMGSSTPIDTSGCGGAGADAAPGWAQTLNQYFYDIDQSDYASAFAQEVHASSQAETLSDFTQAVGSSTDFDPTATDDDPWLFNTVGHVHQGVNHASAEVTFTSNQHASQGPDHEACTVWSLRYRFVRTGGLWLMQGSTPVSGRGYRSCTAG